MTENLQGKSVVITGAATGIGRAVAVGAAEQGAKVTLLDVNETAGKEAASEVGGTFLPLNVADADAWAATAKDIGTPDYVHLNAGVMCRPASDKPENSDILSVDLESYRRITSINIDGVVFGLRALAPKMKDKGGTFTVTASLAGFVPVPYDAAYSMTKHAMIGLVRSVAGNWEGTNMRINAVCPGVVNTAIVPDSMRDLPAMSPDVIANEVFDLFVNGANGETRLKIADEVPAMQMTPPEFG